MKLRFLVPAVSVLFTIAGGPSASAQGSPPGFTASFGPSTIGPGSTSTLTFTISNPGATPLRDLAFSNVLPAGVTIATPALAVTDCADATLTAADGGSMIGLSGGQIGAGVTCTVAVNVVSATEGTHMNVSGDLTSSAGNSGSAGADLIVAVDRPGFSKVFAPASVSYGGRTTLTYTIDNSANASPAYNPDFVDVLPAGIEIASPANAHSDCSETSVIADPGSDTIRLRADNFGVSAVAAGAVCTVSVDVVGEGVGRLNSVSGELTTLTAGYLNVSSGIAGATLEVTRSDLAIRKTFTDDPVLPGGVVTLEYTISNFSRSDAATDIAFSDDLGSVLPGLAAVGLPLADVCGVGSVVSGSTLVSLTGGNLPPGGSSTFSVAVQVPAGAVVGAYESVSSSITAEVGGAMVVGSPATETLFVDTAPEITMRFLNDPVGAGSTVTLEFTISNTSATATVTDIEFTDNLSAFLPGVQVSALPPPGFCGPGASMTAIEIGGELTLVMTDGSLAPAASSSFSVDLAVPTSAPGGTRTNTAGPVSATVDGRTATGSPTSADLTVVAGLRLTKSITDDPVLPGGTVTLEYTLELDATAPGDATAISFSDDLGAVIPGLVAVGLPLSDVCGVGSQLSGSNTVSFTGGTLTPGTACTFSVAVQVPGTASPGSFASGTSDVTATILGVTTLSPGASDILDVSGLELTHRFVESPVLPGSLVNVEYTLSNVSPVADATDIVFVHSLNSVISGLFAVDLPATPCGPGSSITGTTQLIFSGGSLAAGESCSFQVTAQVPVVALEGGYPSAISTFVATVAGTPVSLTPATGLLEIAASPLSLLKEFTDDPAVPGGTVTLEYTLTNLSESETITDIAFSDDLDSAMPGLVAVGLPMTDVCGAGSQISGTGLVSLSGGRLGPGETCVVSVTLEVPASAPLGGMVTSTTSQVTGMAGGTSVTGDPASDDLRIGAVTFFKNFDATVLPGGTVILRYTIGNLSPTDTLTDLAFTEDLDAVVSGLVATGLPAEGVCGTGSRLTGTSFLTLTGGTLGPREFCFFSVTLQVPAGIQGGVFPSTTSALTSSGLPLADPATATLEVIGTVDLQVSMIDTPDPVTAGSGAGNLTHVVTVTNAGPSNASGVMLSEVLSLPAGVSIDSITPSGATTYVPPGASTGTWAVGNLAAGASETLTLVMTVDANAADGAVVGDTAVVTAVNEMLINPGDDSASESSTVQRQVDLQVSKTDTPDPVTAGSGAGNLSHVVTVTNAGPSDASGVVLNEVASLPAGVSVLSIIPGGTTTYAPVDMSPGTWTVGDLAAGASVTLTVVMTVDAGAVDGSIVSDTASVTAVNETLINTGDDSASESTTVQRRVDLAVSQSESIDPVVAGSGTGNLSYIVTVTNSGPSDANGASLSEVLTLPAGVGLDSVTPSAGTYAGGVNGTWALGDLAAGSSATLNIMMTADASAGEGVDVISSTATVTGLDEPDTNPANDSATEATSVVREFDVALTQTESVDPVVAGSGVGNLVYVLTATNSGPADVNGLQISRALTLPADVTIDSIVPGSGTVAGSAIGTWDLPGLAAGGSETLTITLTVAAGAPNGGTVSSTASLAVVNGTDTNPANDSVTEDTQIVAGVDLVVSGMESADPVIAGSGPGNLVYNVDVTNNGPLAATGVELDTVLTLPVGTVVASMVPSAGTHVAIDPLTGTWMLGDLGTGAVARLTVTLDVGSSTAAGIDVVAAMVDVSAVDQVQINSGDESFAEATSVAREVDLVVRITESADPVAGGSGLPGNLTHTVTVSNNGPSDAGGVSLNVGGVIPAAVTLDSTVPSVGNYAAGVWDALDLGAGSSASLARRFSVAAAASGGVDTIRTDASVAAVNESLVSTGDDVASEATSVISPADIGTLEVDASPVLDLQSGLFRQRVQVTNSNPLPIAGFRLLVRNLPGDVSLYNAQGDVGAVPFVDYGQELPSGGSVTLTLEFFRPSLDPDFDPVYEVSEVFAQDPVDPPVAPAGLAIDRVAVLPGGDFLIEFTANPGSTYAVEYSDDSLTWNRVVPSIVAPANRVQWIDSGPPKTASRPGARMYRIVLITP